MISGGFAGVNQVDNSQSSATLSHWSTWSAGARERGLDIPDQPDWAPVFERVCEGSEFVTQLCRRQPELFWSLFTSGDLAAPYPAEHYRHQLQSAMAEIQDQNGLMSLLRRRRQREMLRIIWRDLSGAAPLAETMAELSALADACVDLSLQRLSDWAWAEYGRPRGADARPQTMIVLGMGKLGAGELNLSSDIDLIFAYPEEGETSGPRVIDNSEFFIRLAQRLIQVLDNKTPEGFVFRVDARLRPFGGSGPLAMSFAAMEDYYQFQAREWERYAMIKARVIAGDPAAGAQLQAMLRPFVYRRYLDFSVIESLREMKRLISQELRRKGMAENIKLGPGGIREIEFIGQVYQLIRGGRDTELQLGPILEVLQRLGDKGHLPMKTVEELSLAYHFLRRLENHLQAWADQQTHVLPTDREIQGRLARSLGFATWEALLGRLDDHRQRVQEHFDAVFGHQGDNHQAESGFDALWRGEMTDAASRDLLEERGFIQASEAVELLHGFRQGHACRSLSTRAAERLGRLMPELLEAVAGSVEPDQALKRLLQLLENIVRRSAYIALLVEHPIAMRQLVRLSAASPWIARLLTRYPLLLDELLDPHRLYAPLERRDLEAELGSLLAHVDADDLEQQMERLRQFSQTNRLRVAAADITGEVPLMRVSDHLTDIAEVVLERLVQLAFRHLCGKHGRPSGLPVAGSGFAIIGYGKLGGIELGYGSDLDLVFLHSSRDPNAMTDGASAIANDMFYARLGRRIIHMLNTQTPAGILYEVDMRLRPNGNAGLLVSSLEAFAEYQSESAWTWEHQALARARAVAGDPAVRQRFAEIRRLVLTKPRDPETLGIEVREMREKMRRELDKGRGGRFDLKQGRGGIADIEFMVQFLVLRWAHNYPDLVDFSDNIRMLEGLARHRLVAEAVAERLAEAYRRLRAAIHRNSLLDAPGMVPETELAEERSFVAETWRQWMEAEPQTA